MGFFGKFTSFNRIMITDFLMFMQRVQREIVVRVGLFQFGFDLDAETFMSVSGRVKFP